MKVAIIGAGDVGAASAQRIAEADLADVVLLDIASGKAEAVAMDLSSASSIAGHSRSITATADYQDIAGAGIVVLTAGSTRKHGQSRDDLLLNNARVVKDISQKIARHCLDCIVIVVTNPLDVMTYLTFKAAGLAANRIIGMGGVSDCARFNMLVARELNTASHYVESRIIGPHSDSMVILPRLSTALGTSITELLPKDRIEKIVKESKEFGARIVKLLGQGSAFYGPSAGVFALVDAIVNDRKKILCVSAWLRGEYGLKDLCIGVAAKIGRLGIEEIIELKLNKGEREEFLSSAAQVKTMIDKLGV